MIFSLAEKTCKQFVYIDVIYFFVMHETSVHTVFELPVKKSPSLLFILHGEKDFPFVDSILHILPQLLHSNTADEDACCNTRVLGVQRPGVNIITRCAGTKSHTYDESWHRIECHIFTI
jgi:hypothetical protein